MEDQQVENKSLTIPVAIIAAGIIIAGAIFFTRDVKTEPGEANNNNAQVQQNNNTLPAPLTNADHVLGSPDAPVTFIVYTDLECPFCRRFHETTLKSMMEEYGKDGEVKLVYRHFPLPATMHPNALNFALASECVAEAGGQAKFWEFVDKLFSTNATNLTDALTVAQSLGLDKTQINDCVTSQKFLAKVKADQTDGQKIGVAGTPYSVIIKDGKATPIDGGAIPYEQLKPILEGVI